MNLEYKVVKTPTSTSIAQIENALNNHGKNGWNLIAVFVVGTDYVFYLKHLIAE